MSDEVWRVPADDGSGEIVEIRPVTITPPISITRPGEDSPQ